MTDSKAPKRTAAEIEAEIAQTRTDLTETVNALTDRLSPKNQLAGAKESAIAAADKLADKAAGFLSTAGEATVSFADDATEMARTLVDEVKVKAKSLADDAVEGDPKALAIISGAVAGTAALIAAAFLRRRG